MLGIESIRGFLPSVHIKGVVLQEPKQIETTENVTGVVVRDGKNLNVNVKVSAITTANNDLGDLGATRDDFFAVPDFNFNDHLRVAVLQSYDEDVTAVLQTMGSDITKYIGPLNQWKGSEKFNDILYSTVAVNKGIERNKLPDFKKQTISVQTKKLFGDTNKPKLEKIDQNGVKVSSVFLPFSFTVSQQNPTHLTYFVLCYLDINSMVGSLQNKAKSLPESEDLIDLNPTDFDKIGGITTPLKFDTVFDDGKLSGTTFFYRLPNGKIWTGPVHQMPDGGFMTENKHSPNSVRLTIVETMNVKIQDFRNREGIMSVRIMDDFRNEERTVRDIITGFEPKERSINPTRGSSLHPYISDLFLSKGGGKISKFMFLINFDELLTNNSVFGKVIKTNRISLRKEIFERSKIKSMKIFRQKVKKVQGTNSIGSAIDKYLPQGESPRLIALTAQRKNRKIIDVNSVITEEIDMSFSNTGIRSFNVIDKDLFPTSRSQYQYYIDLEIQDGTLDYLREKIINLRDFAGALENYSSDVLNSTVRDDDSSRSANPHIKNSGVLVRTREVGGYDPKFDGLTQNFAVDMENKYSEEMESGIGEFIKVLKIFMQDNQLDINKETKLGNFLHLITDPKTTNPESILVILELVYQSIARMSSFVGENVTKTDPKTKNSENVFSKNSSFSEKGAIAISKTFNNILDLTRQEVGGYDYLSKNTAENTTDSSNQVGLRSITGRAYRERIDRETLKYFTSTQPEITEGMTAQNTKFAGADAASKTSLTYLSPAIVRVNPPIDLLNAGRVDDGSLTRLVEAKVAQNVTEVDNSAVAPVYSPKFSSRAKGASEQNVDTQGFGDRGVALKEQVDYFTKDYGMVPVTSEVQTLADRKNDNVQLPAEEEDREKQSEAAERPTTTSSPLDFYTSLFQRDVNKNKDDKKRAFKTRAEDSQIGLFDLSNGKNYLKGVSQSAVSNLPNQVKALFMSSTGNSSNVRFRPSKRKNVFKDPSHSASARMKFKLLVEVQYLDGFEISRANGRQKMLMTAPKFKKLTRLAFSQFVGKKLLCRLKKYELPQWGIVRPKKLDIPVYDEYFILEPDTPLEGIDPRAAAGDFLLDPSKETFAASGFGQSEKAYSDLKEFGSSRKPGRRRRFKSQRKRDLLRKMSEYKSNINSDLVTDAFNSNITQSGGFRGGSNKNTLVGMRIRDMGPGKANPSLANEINPSTAVVKVNNGSFFANSNLRSLKGNLDSLKAELSLFKAKKSGITSRVSKLNEDAVLTKDQLAKVTVDAEKKYSDREKKIGIEKLKSREEQLKKSVEVLGRDIRKVNRKITKKESEVSSAVAKLDAEAKELQRNIIAENLKDIRAQVRTDFASGSAIGQTDTTVARFNDTENLQGIFSFSVTGEETKGVDVSSDTLNSFKNYSSYMTEADAASYNNLLAELSEYSSTPLTNAEQQNVITSALGDIREQDTKEFLLDTEDDFDFNYEGTIEKFRKIKNDLSSVFNDKSKRKIMRPQLAKIISVSGIPSANQNIVIKVILDDVFEE